MVMLYDIDGSERQDRTLAGHSSEPGQDDAMTAASEYLAEAGRNSRAARWLGAELRRLRLESGISQRRLTQLIGLSAHSNLGEYERGSRIPPGDIVLACERLLPVPSGYLQQLHQLALRERARARCWPHEASHRPGAWPAGAGPAPR
jgi:hypothetical protein